MTGISTAADSIYVIRNLVFEQERFTLRELVSCLRSNWGRNTEGIDVHLPPDRINQIRSMCIVQPKFGHGEKDVDECAWSLIRMFDECLRESRDHHLHTKDWRRLEKAYPNFSLHITPGVGTFEQYVFGGQFAGASADGRYSGDPIASDLSPSPLHTDVEPYDPETGRHARTTLFDRGLKSFADPSINLLSDGAPADFNIREDFPQQSLVRCLRQFAKGKGGNCLTVTVANPATLSAAEADSDRYQLVRVRMGGWTEFFSVLFPAHKGQHRRRPLYQPPE